MKNFWIALALISIIACKKEEKLEQQKSNEDKARLVSIGNMVGSLNVYGVPTYLSVYENNTCCAFIRVTNYVDYSAPHPQGQQNPYSATYSLNNGILTIRFVSDIRNKDTTFNLPYRFDAVNGIDGVWIKNNKGTEYFLAKTK